MLISQDIPQNQPGFFLAEIIVPRKIWKLQKVPSKIEEKNGQILSPPLFFVAIFLSLPRDFRCFSTRKCGWRWSSWWFQPIWKILYSQIGSSPQVIVQITNIWNHLVIQRRIHVPHLSDLLDPVPPSTIPHNTWCLAAWWLSLSFWDTSPWTHHAKFQPSEKFPGKECPS